MNGNHTTENHTGEGLGVYSKGVAYNADNGEQTKPFFLMIHQ